jgi:glutaminyl-tRNA synthetase
LIQLVDEAHVSGWDDPRMPTIAGIRRRGYTPSALREFCLRIGVTKMDNMVEMGMLEACIRDELNQSAPRRMAVLEPLKLVIENYPQDKTEILDAPNHPNDESMGTRSVPFTKEIFIEKEDFRIEANKKFKRLVLNKEVRLRNAYVVRADRVDTDESGEVTTVYCTYDEQTLGVDPADGRKVKGVIHWVSAEHGLNAEIRLYDRLFNVPNPAAEEDFTAAINPESLTIKQGVVEPSLAEAELASAFQFERTGYFCVDKDSSEQQLVFNRTVGLRDTWERSQ